MPRYGHRKAAGRILIILSNPRQRDDYIPRNSTLWHNVVSMLGQRCRRRPSMETTLCWYWALSRLDCGSTRASAPPWRTESDADGMTVWLRDDSNFNVFFVIFRPRIRYRYVLFDFTCDGIDYRSDLVALILVNMIPVLEVQVTYEWYDVILRDV